MHGKTSHVWEILGAFGLEDIGVYPDILDYPDIGEDPDIEVHPDIGASSDFGVKPCKLPIGTHTNTGTHILECIDRYNQVCTDR